MSVSKTLKTEVLKDELKYLCDELGDPGRYFPHLRSKTLLDVKDCERIRSKVTSFEKTEELLNILLKREGTYGEHPLDILISELKKQRVQVHIARRLQRTLKKKSQNAETTNGDFQRKQSPSAESNDSLDVSPTKPIQRAVSATRSTTPLQSSYAINPVVGAIPNEPPPLSTQTHSVVVPESDQYHAQFGVGPSTPPLITKPSSQHIDGVGKIPKQSRVCADTENEPGGQSMITEGGQSMTGLSLTDSSLFTFSTESSSHNVDLEQVYCVMMEMKAELEATKQENSRLRDLLRQQDLGGGHRPGTLFPPTALYPLYSDPSGHGYSKQQHSLGKSNTNHSLSFLGETSSIRSTTSSTSVNSNPSLPSTPRTQFQSDV